MNINQVGDGRALYAWSEKSSAIEVTTQDITKFGIIAYNDGGGTPMIGVGSGSYPSVHGYNYMGGIGLKATSIDIGSGATPLVASLYGSSGNIAEFKVSSDYVTEDNVARIDNTGKGFFNGGVQLSGADVAEMFEVEGNVKQYEPGDVLVISQSSDRKIEKSATPYSTQQVTLGA